MFSLFSLNYRCFLVSLLTLFDVHDKARSSKRSSLSSRGFLRVFFDIFCRFDRSFTFPRIAKVPKKCNWCVFNVDVFVLEEKKILPWSLTVCPWKMVVGRLLSYWEGNFQGRTVKLQKSKHTTGSIPCFWHKKTSFWEVTETSLLHDSYYFWLLAGGKIAMSNDPTTDQIAGNRIHNRLTLRLEEW